MREGWQKVRLGEIAETLLGKTLPRGSGSDHDGWPYLRNVNVQWGRVSTDNLNRMPFDGSERSKYGLRRGDLLVCEGGEVGRLAILKNDLPDVFFQNALHRIRVDRAHAEPAFVALALEATVRTGGLGGMVTRVTIAHLNQTKLRSIPFNLPPLAEQRRIVDLVGAVDEAIEAADAEADSSRKYWSQLVESLMVSSEAVRTPIAEIVRLSKAGGTPSRGDKLNYGGGIPWLKSGEVTRRGIRATEESITEQGLATSSAWMVPSGTVLVAMYGATAGQVGTTATSLATNQAVLALLPDPSRVHSDLLYHLLAGSTSRLKERATGAAQPNLSKGTVLRFEVGVPPIERQSVWVGVLEGILDSTEAARATADALRTLRSNLLTVLLSGEHEIPATYDALLTNPYEAHSAPALEEVLA